MAVLKCKMCGATLTVGDNDKFAQCRYCDSMQTLPNLDNELKIKLFERATDLRLVCDFDQAAGVFQSIIAQFPDEAEAHWGLVLCKYGIEYVDDPKDGKKVPTCHRTRYQSVLNDTDFIAACELSTARWKYEEEAQVIDDLQQKILSISRAEEPYDVFICYKETDDTTRVRTEDSMTAQDLYTELSKDYKVFFSRVTLRGKAGSEYEPYIYAALSSAKVMLVLGSKQEYFNAVWLKNEWSRYLEMMKDSDKILIPCYESITPEQLPRQLQSFQALDMRSITFLSDLRANIARVVDKAPAAPAVQAAPTASAPVTDGNRKELNFDDGAYVGEAIGDSPHGYGARYYKNGDKYEGEWHLGVKQGQGTYTYASGETWTGEWNDDKQENGNGTIWIVRDGKPTGNRYEGALVSGNRHGYGTYFYANGDRYEGAFKDGKPNGQGTYTYASGETWTGEWKDGARFAGNGFVLFFKDGKPTGERYNGEMANGKLHGHGVYTFQNGERYEGAFESGNYNGNGAIVYANGDRYEGAFVNGKRHGYGTYTFKNGDRYEGNHVDGLANGQGTYTYASGESWTGELKNNNRFNGSGTVFYFKDGKPTGERYDGALREGKYHGKGVKVFSNGDRYEGGFANGKQQGQAVYVFANGDKYEGSFVDNQLCGQGTYTYASGETWTGEWKDGKRWNGSGTVLLLRDGKPTGGRYDGAFVDGKQQGQGTFTFANGDKYEGEFVDGNFHGQGTYTYANGETWTGEWKDGKRFTGNGTILYYQDGKPTGGRYDGELVAGEYHGRGIQVFSSGNRYEGEFANGKSNGRGVYTRADGEIWSGEWRNDELYNGTKCDAKGAVTAVCKNGKEKAKRSFGLF